MGLYAFHQNGLFTFSLSVEMDQCLPFNLFCLPTQELQFKWNTMRVLFVKTFQALDVKGSKFAPIWIPQLLLYAAFFHIRQAGKDNLLKAVFDGVTSGPASVMPWVIEMVLKMVLRWFQHLSSLLTKLWLKQLKNMSCLLCQWSFLPALVILLSLILYSVWKCRHFDRNTGRLESQM